MTEVDLNSDMGEGFGPWTIGDLSLIHIYGRARHARADDL